MPVDLPNALNLMRADLALLEESLNGLENTECADRSPHDVAAIQAAIATYKDWLLDVEPIVGHYESLQKKGYPIFPTFPVSMATKARLRAELKASTVAEALFIGRKSAVSGTLNFGTPVPAAPKQGALTESLKA